MLELFAVLAGIYLVVALLVFIYTEKENAQYQATNLNINPKEDREEAVLVSIFWPLVAILLFLTIIEETLNG